MSAFSPKTHDEPRKSRSVSSLLEPDHPVLELHSWTPEPPECLWTPHLCQGDAGFEATNTNKTSNELHKRIRHCAAEILSIKITQQYTPRNPHLCSGNPERSKLRIPCLPQGYKYYPSPLLCRPSTNRLPTLTQPAYEP